MRKHRLSPGLSSPCAVGLAPGGLVDVLARTVQPHPAEALKQTVIVENRAVRAATWREPKLRATAGQPYLPAQSVDDRIGQSTDVRQHAVQSAAGPAAGCLAGQQPVVPVCPVFAWRRYARSVRGVRAQAARSAQLRFGRNGTTPHLAGELLKQATGIPATHAPYRGVAPAIQDLAAGQIDFAFGPATVFPMVQAGKLKVLAVASRQRAAVAPDIRTFPRPASMGFRGQPVRRACRRWHPR